ncbi:MAG: oligosaccharide flippase family protein [Planctomycetes bacterium]|nr:oligosaccharide flippase family protein [Planctomycetota bacterium]
MVVRGLVLVLNLGSGVITARWLGPKNMGVYALVVLLPAMAFRFGNLGFGSAATFYAARKEVSNKALLSVCLKLGLFASIITGIMFLFIRNRSFSPWRGIDFRLFLLFSPSVLFQFWIFYLSRILNGNLRILQVNISSVINGCAMLIFKFAFLVIFDWGIWGALIAAELTFLAVCSYLFWQARLLVKEPAGDVHECHVGELVKSMWQYGRWSYLIMFTDYFYTQLPLFFLKNFFALDIVGYYSLSRGLEDKTRVLVLPFSAMLYPFNASSKETDAINRTNMLCRTSILAMFFLTATLFLFAKWFILLMYGQDYLPSVGVFYALLFGIFIWPLGNFLGVHLAASGKPKLTFFANAVALCFAGVICYFVIPPYGAVGASVSVSLTYSFRAFVQLIIYLKVTKTSVAEVLCVKKADIAYAADMIGKIMKRLNTKTV